MNQARPLSHSRQGASITPESVMSSFIGKLVTVEYHGNKEATGRLQALGGGILVLQQLDGRARVIMLGSVITLAETIVPAPTSAKTN